MKLEMIYRHYTLGVKTEDWSKFKGFNNGDIINVEIKRPRNLKFHRKYFALLKAAFEVWPLEEQEYKTGKKIYCVKKDFERFRKDIAIMTGFCDCVYRIDGTPILNARSISFKGMSEQEFEVLYNRTIDVILQKILTNYNKDDLDEVVNNILNFD